MFARNPTLQLGHILATNPGALTSNSQAVEEDDPLIAPTMNFGTEVTTLERTNATPGINSSPAKRRANYSGQAVPARKVVANEEDDDPLVAPTMNFDRPDRHGAGGKSPVTRNGRAENNEDSPLVAPKMKF